MNQVLICGGSLAGLACAIRLKQLGINPLVIEKHEFPRAKLCGEFLGPSALASLCELGLLDIIQKKACGPVEQVYFYNNKGSRVCLQLPVLNKKYGFGLAMPRYQLDAMIMGHARALGVRILEGTRVLSYKKDNECFTVYCEQGNAKSSYKSKFVVDASGRNTALRPSKPNKNMMVGLQCHAFIDNAVEDLHMFAFPGGYGGIQSIGNQSVNICMLVKPTLAATSKKSIDEFLDLTIRSNPAAKAILLGAQLDGKILSSSVANMDVDLSDKKLFHIGDSLITPDPFIGFGMAHALETGCLSADIMSQAIQSQKPYSQARNMFYKVYNQRYKNRLSLVRLIRHCIMAEQLQGLYWPALPYILPMFSQRLI